MKKKTKIIYFVVIALSIIACVMDIITAHYMSAYIMGLNTYWLIMFYLQSKIIFAKDEIINDCLKLIDDTGKLSQGGVVAQESTQDEGVDRFSTEVKSKM